MNIELNRFWARFNVWMNFQNVSPMATRKSHQYEMLHFPKVLMPKQKKTSAQDATTGTQKLKKVPHGDPGRQIKTHVGALLLSFSSHSQDMLVYYLR